MLRRIFSVSVLATLLVPFLANGADFPLTDKNPTITFLGTKPGGKHYGGFNGWIRTNAY